ncbi:MAG: hypothetical protein QOH75_2460 [Actinomycetota bacterium]|nr:hypothetical protein [Actinomycetota bacterium]
MCAQVSDQIVIHSTHVDEPVRDGEVLEVRGHDGAPPYPRPLVRPESRSPAFPGT